MITGYEPFALHAPIQWAMKGHVITKRGSSNVLLAWVKRAREARNLPFHPNRLWGSRQIASLTRFGGQFATSE